MQKLLLLLLCSFPYFAVAQNEDSLKCELAYWYKHPLEWKVYKLKLAQAKENYTKHLDSVQNYKAFRLKLQEEYDRIADRVERADSLAILYAAKKKAVLMAQNRRKHALTFKIQIQTARKHELDAYLLPNTNLSIEKMENGQKRYMIGNFKVYEEAQSLAEVLRDGEARTYIVAYKHGKRLQNFAQYLD